MYQYNIPLITSPFIQQVEQTYWLMISADGQGGIWGWNTAKSVSGSSAVFRGENDTDWAQLMTPVGYQDPRIPLDMAFVLVPEPTTLLILALGGLLLRRRK